MRCVSGVNLVAPESSVDRNQMYSA